MKYRIFTIFIWFCSAYAKVMAEVKVDVDLLTQFPENSPISGTVIVSHTSTEKINLANFKINRKPLAVQLQHEESMTVGNLILSMYSFSLPSEAKGLYILPAISVTVDGKEYRSIPRTYEITGKALPLGNNPTPPPSAGIPAQKTTQTQQPTTAAPATASASTSQDAPLLKLEAFVDGPHEIYPGQRTVIGYRYFYNVNVDTSKEVLPLLEAEGLTKIGDKIIKAEETEGLSVQQFAQQVEGNKPGQFKFGPSILEGTPYQTNSSGVKFPSKQLLSSTAPVVDITVLPFPEKDKPASFNGALGTFQWKIDLVSPPLVNVGDEVELSVTAKGKGNLENLQLPELCCQPGMSGPFKLSDLPSVGEINGDTKYFKLKISPTTTSVKAIPALEFSSFDPDSRKYVTYLSQPIPLSVTSLNGESSDKSDKIPSNELPSAKETPSKKSKQAEQIQSEAPAEPIEIESIYPLSYKDLKDLSFGTWVSLFLIPFGLAALLFQVNLSKYYENLKLESKIIGSKELFTQALKSPVDSAEEHSLMIRAFILALKEKKLIPSAEIAPEDLPKEGIIGDVKDFLYTLDEKRYLGVESMQKGDSRQKAQELFDQLQNFGGVK
ncbi:MAG: BatD family protein [Parachlamydiaceae bacterium]|nr:BatD family protein [Parachlamydiaceae bacterium]